MLDDLFFPISFLILILIYYYIYYYLRFLMFRATYPEVYDYITKKNLFGETKIYTPAEINKEFLFFIKTIKMYYLILGTTSPHWRVSLKDKYLQEFRVDLFTRSQTLIAISRTIFGLVVVIYFLVVVYYSMNFMFN